MIRARSTHAGPVAALTVALVLAVGLVGCGSEERSSSAGGGEQLRPFTIVLDWTPNTNHAGIYLAQSEGWYEEAGLDVEIIEPGESGSLQLLAAGKAEVAVSVQEALIPARAEGLPVRSVAAIIEHNTSSLLSLADEGIETPADLEGKTYGGFGGELERALIDRLVECDGGDPSKVRFVDVGEANYRVGMERDQYDVVWIFDGWDGLRLSEVEGVETSTIPFADHTDCIPDWYTPLLATSEAVEDERGDDLDAFLAATSRGYQAAMADPEAAADALLASSDDLDEELVRASAEYLSTRYADDPAAWGRQDAERWDEFATFLVDAGLLDEPIAVEDAWTDDHLPDA